MNNVGMYSQDEVMEFIGLTPWDEITLLGYESDGSEINTTLDNYTDLDDLDNFIEAKPPMILTLNIGLKSIQLW